MTWSVLVYYVVIVLSVSYCRLMYMNVIFFLLFSVYELLRKKVNNELNLKLAVDIFFLGMIIDFK